MKVLIYLGSSTFNSTIYDGGASINSSLLRYLQENRRFRLKSFGTNLSEKVIQQRGGIDFEDFVVVRKHSDESVFLGMLKNLLAILKNPSFKRALKRDGADYIWSGSDFWPDAIPAFLIKMANQQAKWIACFYLFAPSPWARENPYIIGLKSFIIGSLYFITQLPVYFIVRHFADILFVTSEPDVYKFITKKRNKSQIIVIQGGVDVSESEKYLQSGLVVPVEKRKYDACFVGRFHYQKGILELIDIWNIVCQKRNMAKLAVIGVGPLEEKVKVKIKQKKLERNIELLGFLDGKEKHEIFKQSKIMVHPATYDSGGMAAAEGMAWKLPAIAFDLEALKTYYPKGVLKIKKFDIAEFASNILKLMNYPIFYEKTAKEAHNLVVEVWDWNKRLEMVCDRVFGEDSQ